MNRYARSVLWAIALVLGACSAPSAELETQTVSTGPLEASEMLPVHEFSADWEEAYWIIGDEKELEGNLRLLIRARGSETWQVLPVAATLTKPGIKTDDAEALCRHDGYVYVFGSHFGKKQGPLELDRQFVARFKEPKVGSATDARVIIEIGTTDFELHRLVNDALQALAAPVIEARPKTRELLEQPVKGLSKEDQARIHPDDLPLNIEGVAFLDSGDVLIGLRFPVTAAGHPILIQVSGIESLFGGAEPELSVTGSWILENAGSPKQLMGIRAMAVSGGQLDLIAGSIERNADDDPPILMQDYPEGIHGVSMHLRLPLEALNAGRVLQGKIVQTFENKSIESVATTAQGERYVVDMAKNVEVLYTRK